MRREINAYLYSVIAGQIFFIIEIFSLLFYPFYFNSNYTNYAIINYAFNFLIQIMLIIVLFLNLQGKLRYTVPIILVPVVGQIMQGVYILIRTEGDLRTKIRLTAIYYILMIFAIISAAYVQIPSGFPAGTVELKVFAITLSIADVFNVAVLLYLFYIFKRWIKGAS